MLLTMQSAWREIADSPEKNVSEIAHKVAHGALMGARGNSGVILSQVWRGVARGLDGKEVFSASDLAAAVEEGAQTAYKGVIRPVEGTILTVAREMAEEALQAATETQDTIVVLERMVRRGRDTVARTPGVSSDMRYGRTRICSSTNRHASPGNADACEGPFGSTREPGRVSMKHT